MVNRVGQQLGNYRLLQLLGQGGFAEVYLAEHVYLRRKVAIKVLAGTLTNQDMGDFLREAQTIAAFKHAHILPVFDFGMNDATPFLVMEYAANGTLRDRHPRGVQLPLATVISYVNPIAHALQYAHNARVIHRDVKPENMLLDEHNNLLLSDFGIAAVAHSTSSVRTLDSVGTPHYMSPEQFQGRPVVASDQYSLAIVVYEWLCGQRPFSGDSFFAIGMQHISTPAPSPRLHNPHISSDVEYIIQMALAKDPQQRFQNIMAFSSALEHANQALHTNPLFPAMQQPTPLPTQPLPYTRPTPPSTQKSETLLEESLEEEILIGQIQSLAKEAYSSSATTQLTAIKDIIQKHARYFQQSGPGNRVREAFKRAFSSDPPNAGRCALALACVEFFGMLGTYDEALINCIQSLSKEAYTSSADTQFKAMKGIIQVHTTFFQQSERAQTVYEAFKRAFSSDPPDAGRNSLALANAEFSNALGNYDEALIGCIRSLAKEAYSSSSTAQLKAIKETLLAYPEFFQQATYASRVREAFKRAFASEPPDAGRNALALASARFFSMLGEYDEALINCIRSLAKEPYNSSATAQLKAMKDIMQEYAQFFQQSEHLNNVREAFKRAISSNPPDAGRSALETGRADFLNITRW